MGTDHVAELAVQDEVLFVIRFALENCTRKRRRGINIEKQERESPKRRTLATVGDSPTDFCSIKLRMGASQRGPLR